MTKHFFRPPFIIDVEASGFGPFSYPIEIGLALGNNERYCSLIRPCSDWEHWDKKAQAVHHISRQNLLKNGKHIHEVACEINALLDRLTVFSDCWGVDKPWVTRLFEKAGIAQTFHISPLEMILSEAQMEIWHETKNHIITTRRFERHRASIDALIIQETYVQTYKKTRS